MVLASDERSDRGEEFGVERLTDAERHVCQLAATGLTNRQIADERCVSVKAVEFHLHNAYVKLNVANRTQLACRLFEQRRSDGALASSPGAPAPHPPPPAATRVEIEAAAEAMLREVLEAVSSEIGGRALSDAELARLHDCVAAEVAQAVGLRFGLDEPQRATLEESLRRRLRTTFEADTLAS